MNLSGRNINQETRQTGDRKDSILQIFAICLFDMSLSKLNSYVLYFKHCMDMEMVKIWMVMIWSLYLVSYCYSWFNWTLLSRLQGAYLVGVSDPNSHAGQKGLVDPAQFAKARQSIQMACQNLVDPACTQSQVPFSTHRVPQQDRIAAITILCVLSWHDLSLDRFEKCKSSHSWHFPIQNYTH